MRKRKYLTGLVAIIFLCTACSWGSARDIGGLPAGWQRVENADTAAVGKWLLNFWLKAGSDDCNFDSLLRAVMTPYMYDHARRFGSEHDYSLVILGQDVTDNFAKTARVEYAGKPGWFRLCYGIPAEDAEGGYTTNYAKVVEVGGLFRIAYMYPFGEKAGRFSEARMQDCGDSIFYYTVPRMDISNGSDSAFVRSFYLLYTGIHSTIAADVEQATDSLRRMYLSGNALAQFAKTRAEYAADGAEGYDLLIGGFYSDRFRRQNMRITNLGGGRFEVCVPIGRIIVTIAHKTSGRSYEITNITKR